MKVTKNIVRELTGIRWHNKKCEERSRQGKWGKGKRHAENKQQTGKCSCSHINNHLTGDSQTLQYKRRDLWTTVEKQSPYKYGI